MLWRIAPLAFLALAACGAPEPLSPIACQERILAVRQGSQLDPAQSRTLSNAFRALSKRYAELDESDCNARQRQLLDQLESISSELSRLAAEADTAKRSGKPSNSRMPDTAVIELATELQSYEDRLAIIRRELREMKAAETN